MTVSPPPALPGTLYFPVSGNPIGFNHFASAEWLMRSDPEISRVVFVLSNGHHPDPTKPSSPLDGPTRLAVLQAAIQQVADPERSFLAARAALAGEKLLCSPDTLSISQVEFNYPRAVRTAEWVADVQREKPDRLLLFAGSDLVRRMRHPAIFTDDDLDFLSRQCRYRIMEREPGDLEGLLAGLKTSRGFQLEAVCFPLDQVPQWLAPFFFLSSTCLRHALESGDPLEGMAPRQAAALLRQGGSYRPPRPVVWLKDREEQTLKTLSRLQFTLDALEGAVEEAALAVHQRLMALKVKGAPHTLALVEAATGGLMGQALLRQVGASGYFLEGRVAYGEESKRQLFLQGGEPPNLPAPSAVTEETALRLARAMRAVSGAHYVLAESGMAGPPDGQRRSFKNGWAALGFSSQGNSAAHTLKQNPFNTRREHQLQFAAAGLRWLLAQLPE